MALYGNFAAFMVLHSKVWSLFSFFFEIKVSCKNGQSFKCYFVKVKTSWIFHKNLPKPVAIFGKFTKWTEAQGHSSDYLQ